MWFSQKKIKVALLDILGIGEKGIPQLIKEVRELVGPKEAVPKLKRELEELKLQKDISERDIKHLVTLKEEKLEIDHQKKEVQLEKKFQEKEMKMQTEYHDKIMATIEKARKEQQDTYKEIMKRLPNVNMRIEDKK